MWRRTCGDTHILERAAALRPPAHTRGALRSRWQKARGSVCYDERSVDHLESIVDTQDAYLSSQSRRC